MKLQNTFVQGKMNKDTDERLLPKGQYPHAENIRVINSEGSDIGAVENVRGNKALTSFSLTNATTIGAFTDDSNQKIYWFTTSEDRDLLVEYDYSNQVSTILLDDTTNILNFNKDFLITGVVKIFNEEQKKDLLVWTDDLNPPRVINIERAKGYAQNGFDETDISLIKRPPRDVIVANLTFSPNSLENNIKDKFLVFSYRYKYLDGEYSALAPFSQIAFEPSEFGLNYQTQQNTGMVNTFNAVDLQFNTGGSQVVEIQVVVKESQSNNVSIIQNFSKKENNWADDTTQTYLFSNNQTLTTLPDDELLRVFDNVPIKAKALDLVGSRLVFGNYVEGYDLVDLNGLEIVPEFYLKVKEQSSFGVDISNRVENDKLVITTEIPLEQGSNIGIRYEIVSQENSSDVFSVDINYILQENYTNLRELVESSGFKRALRVQTAVFLQTPIEDLPENSAVQNTVYDENGNFESGSTPFLIQVIDDNNVILCSPKYVFDILDEAGEIESTESIEWSAQRSNPLPEVFYSSTSIYRNIKTDRSYEAGITYYDSFGRASTIITSDNTVAYNSIENIEKNNILEFTINSKAPAWAEYYSISIKQNKGNYHNIFATQFFEEGIFRWIKLEGDNIQKVRVGDNLLLKSDNTGLINDPVSTPVLDIQRLENDELGDGTYMKIVPTGFVMETDFAPPYFESRGDRKRSNRAGVVFRNIASNIVDGVAEDVEINAGTILNITGNGRHGDDRTNINIRQVAQRRYDNFIEFFEAEVSRLEDDGRLIDRDDYLTRLGGEPVTPYLTRAEDGTIKMFVEYERTGRESERSKINIEVRIDFSGGLVVFETEAEENNNDTFFETPTVNKIVDGNHTGNIRNQDFDNGVGAVVELDFFNTYNFGNGVESISHRDSFIGSKLDLNTRPNASDVNGYRQIRRFADLTYSEPYSENTNVNGLNEFNLARANFKDDIDKKFGFIQKLYTRDTDLVVFQEDKVHKVLFGKDLLTNGDGSGNVTSTEQVLGQHIAYTGEYGISRNPESFDYDANNLYFVDTKRGSVMRLGNNGLTEVSNYGMRRYFKDELRDSFYNKKVGSFDPFHDQYVLSISKETLSVPVEISCGQTFRQGGFSGELNHRLDIGTEQGQVNIDVVGNGVPIQVIVEWNGTEVINTTLTDNTVRTLSFEKTESTSTTANIKISTTECDASVAITNRCIESPEITVMSIVLNDNTDVNKRRVSRYRWSDESFNSPFRTFNSVFEESDIQIDGRDARVDIFDINTGQQGEGVLPIQGSNITLESLNSPENSALFMDGDRIGYLVTDVEYTQDQIQTIINQATFIQPTLGAEINEDPLITTSFTLPQSNNRFVYLIWDYVKKNEAPVAVKDFIDVTTGSSITVDITANDTDADGDSLTVGDIVTQPSFGTLSVSGRFITYTHDGSENLDDEFTYRVFDGTEFSEPETVCISVGVPCGQSISPSGNQGTFVYDINIGTGTGLTGIEYEAFRITDRFTVEYDGQIIGDTGFVSGQGTLTFNKTERTPTRMRVTVIASNGGTAWNFRSICPA